LSVHSLLAALWSLPPSRALGLRVLRNGLLTVLLGRLLARWLTCWDNLFVGRLIGWLGWTEAALGKFVGGKLAHTIIGADLAKKTIISNVALRDVIAAIPQLTYDFRLSVSKNIGILLENLDDLIG
jgi:hypothetical protein